jgi:glycosyltransferase involved in cell wall biosynthesis
LQPWIAVTAGLDYSRGQAVVMMDSDLQDPPEIILEMINKWREGYEVVYAKREERDRAEVQEIHLIVRRDRLDLAAHDRRLAVLDHRDRPADPLTESRDISLRRPCWRITSPPME